ncbi:hypothetical protein PAXRUDRAFT_178655 [Paxillus rubicundulus Ve08.2h10]|uniref:Uncharacterized protein n=1 Tax=Paxillus rubicundulus Ve08.2h10 TaxID=930991 RepID=A0A0D0C9N6_9AGAM|nr:hypothetical protein PAXRUDRAFT_180865 [Paxillus rubicundulus Ve08.2h10]KIK73361.1 hypothetical protein PAXRUDRAFT_178655 [Paxillus rubicundulus Ve08.2h10]
MSTHQWTISHPDMSQSEIHMGLYYVGCWIKSAVLHLVHQPDEYWPDNWQPLLDREFISSHLAFFFQMLHTMQQIHATHPTTVVPAPAVEGLYHVSCRKFGMLVWSFDVRLCSMSTNIPTFLPNWDPILVDNFQGKWWVNDTEHGRNLEGYDVWADTLDSGHKYFQASIILFRPE